MLRWQTSDNSQEQRRRIFEQFLHCVFKWLRSSSGWKPKFKFRKSSFVDIVSKRSLLWGSMTFLNLICTEIPNSHSIHSMKPLFHKLIENKSRWSAGWSSRITLLISILQRNGEQYCACHAHWTGEKNLFILFLHAQNKAISNYPIIINDNKRMTKRILIYKMSSCICPHRTMNLNESCFFFTIKSVVMLTFPYIFPDATTNNKWINNKWMFRSISSRLSARVSQIESTSKWGCAAPERPKNMRRCRVWMCQSPKQMTVVAITRDHPQYPIK